MIVVYLIVAAVLTLFFLIDMYAEAVWDIFACRAYDMLPMVNGPRRSQNQNGNLRGMEYISKNKVLENR